MNCASAVETTSNAIWEHVTGVGGRKCDYRMYDNLIADLRNVNEYDTGYAKLMYDAADAVEELVGFVQEAERDRDEYRERLDKANDAIGELSMKLHGDEAAIAGMKREIERMVVAGKPRWISVTERCPEKSGDYLVFDDCRNLYVNEWHCLLKKWQYDDSRITHWMPLPKPPKEET